MNYLNYSVDDFVMDAHFQEWVQNPDVENCLFWQNWLKAHPEKQETVEQARNMILLIDFREDKPAEGEQEEVWERIVESTHASGVIRQLKSESQWQSFRKWAAVVALMLMSGLILYRINVDKTVRYHTDYGQSKNVLLEDGTTVALNANSTLEVLPNWWGWGESREVRLEGEAFFKVLKKVGLGDKRFIVHTKKFDVEVLGTQFNVFSRDRGSQVVLNSGKVKLNMNRKGQYDSIMMKPGELVALCEGEKLIKKAVDPEQYNDWTRNQWVMEGTSLREITSRLEETFGVTVSFARPDIAQERMTGVISTDNLDDLLDALSRVNELQVQREGNRLLFTR